MRYTISARGKAPELPVMQFLEDNYPFVSLGEIDSLFGFVEKSTLYGGRQFVGPELSDLDITELYRHDIGFRIPLTNHYVEQIEYELNAPLLDKYHRIGNSVIVTNDDLATWIRRDFPDYRIEASVIKNINSYEKIDRAMYLYDTVILPMSMNREHGFLAGIRQKDKITLFANAGCALTCPSKICYASISRLNKYKGGKFMCSQPLKSRTIMGMVDFDLNELAQLGFYRFKLLRARPGDVSKVTGY